MDPSQQPEQEKLLTRRRYKSICKITLIVLNIALSSFYFGYSIKYFSTIPIETLLLIFRTTIDSKVAEGLINACIPAGGLIGALSSSILLAKLSRRNCVLFINGVAFIAGCLIFIENFYVLALLRVVQGFCVGSYSAVVPLIIKQLSPVEISGIMGVFNQLNIAGAIFFAGMLQYVLAQITGSDGEKYWQVIFGFTLITVLLQSLVLVFVFKYETPKYLLLIGKEEQAKQLIAELYEPEFVEEVLEEKKADILANSNSEKSFVMKNQTSSSVVTDVPNVQKSHLPTFVAVHLAVLQQMSGINAVITYGSKIVNTAYPEQANLIATMINFEQVFATTFASLLLARLGRKTILQAGALFEAVACVIVAVGTLIHDDKSTDNGFSNVLVLLGLFLFMAVFGLSLGPVVWLYIPEIVQPKIVPYSTMSNWIAALVVIFLFPVIVGVMPDQNPGYVLLFFALWCIVSFVFGIRKIVETKDRSERQINEEYATKSIC